MIMKKTALIIILTLFVVCPSFAQQNKNKKETDKAPKNVETDSDAPNNGAKLESKVEDMDEAFKTTSPALERENKELKAQIEGLKKDTTKLKLIYAKQQNRIIEYKDSLANIKKGISSMDAIVYKQCLLYPLEGRYNQHLIDESLKAVEAFAQIGGKRSPEFVEYKKVYMPLLEKYFSYNDEIISFIEEKVCKRLVNGSIGQNQKQNIIDVGLKNLFYYRDCYINRNKPPYKSIIYLDEAIDRFIAIMNKSGIIENDLQELLKSLEPK